MKRDRFFFLFLLFFAVACKNKDEKGPTAKSENSIDAARNFIRAALDGKFTEARSFLLPDSTNTNWMDIAERSYQRAEQSVKDGYRSSSINIHKVNNLSDSVSVVIYSNSYKNDHDTLKIIKEKGQWLVDLKYLFEHDRDTMNTQPLVKDTMK